MPSPSASSSSWSSGIPSLSSSLSMISRIPSPSSSSWSSGIPSLSSSLSRWSGTPSLSSSLSRASGIPSPSSSFLWFYIDLHCIQPIRTDKTKNLLLKPINNYKTLSCADSTSAKMVLRHFQAYNGCQQCGEEQKRPHSLYISELSGLSVLWRKRGCPMIVQLPTEYALLGFTN